MELSRKNRKLLVNVLQEGATKRIATQLLKVYSGSSYVQIADVTCPDISVDDFKLKGRSEVILSDVIAAICLVFPDCTNMLFKMLISKSGDIAQVGHTDYVPDKSIVRKLQFKAFHYSAVISLQSSPSPMSNLVLDCRLITAE